MGMEEKFVTDEQLKRLFKKEGLLRTSPDFTLKVMQLVEGEKTKIAVEYRPLLGRKAWMLIVGMMALLLVMAWLFLAREPFILPAYFDNIQAALDSVKKFNLSLHLNTAALSIATITVACIALFIMIDFLLTDKFRDASA